MLTIDRKWQRLYSQSDAHFCFITRLSDEPLYLFVGFPRQKNTIPLQDLHSYTQSHICTQKKPVKTKVCLNNVCWFHIFQYAVKIFHLKPHTNQSPEVSRSLKGSIHSEKTKFTLTWMRDNFRLHRLIKFTQEQSFERKPALILVLKRHVHQTAGQNQRDKCWWQPKQQLCDKAVCRALRHRSGLKWTWNWPHVISARKVEFAGQHFKNDALQPGKNTKSNLAQQWQPSHRKNRPFIHIWCSHESSYESTQHSTLQNTPCRIGRTYTVWNSPSGGSSVCDDTPELWVTKKLL